MRRAMVTDKDVITFLNHARPTLLDLTEVNIKIIEADAELMDILRVCCGHFSKSFNSEVGSSTDLSPYKGMGWYLAEKLRDTVQIYYYYRYGITMSEFIKMKVIDDIKECHENETARELRKSNYKLYFGREFPER